MTASTGAQPPLAFQRALGPLALLTFVFLVNFGSRVILAPLMPAVEADLGIGHGQAGSLFLMISIGYCAGLLGSGFIYSRMEHRSVIGLSVIAMGGTLLAISLNKTLWGLRLGLVFTGTAAGVYLPSALAALSSLVRKEDWGKAYAFHEFGPNFGYMLAPLAVEGLLRWTSWRGALTALGALAVVVGLAFLRFGRGGRSRGDAPNRGSLRALAAKPSLYIMIALFSIGMGSSLGVYSMLPLYLTSGLGFSRSWANTLVALSRVSGVLTVFGSGWLSDRLGPRRALMFVLSTGGVATVLLGIVSGPWVVPLVLLQPTLASWFFPAAFAALSRLGPLGASLAIPFAMVLGAGVIPTLIGVAGEMGRFGEGFATVGVLVLGGALLARGLDREEARPGEGVA